MESTHRDTALLPADRLSAARALFPHIALGKIYLNHAATSPLSTRVVDAMMAHFQERSSGSIDSYWTDLPKKEECRTFVQRLINAESPERIAFTGNTSDAINIVASGVPWKAGDHVLLNDMEFPANVYPYLHLRRLGVKSDYMRCAGAQITPEMITAALTPRTRIVALSAVQFLSGYRANLAAIGELCRRRGIFFVVDGIQAVGAIHIDVQAMKIDALAAGGQKWQMAPHGTGFLYLTEELQAHLQQQYLGWLAVQEPWDFFNCNQPAAASARRYEGGTVNFPGIMGMHAALATLLEFGLDKIERHILALTQMLTDELQKLDGVELLSPAARHERAGIVTIKLPPRVDGNIVLQKISDRNVTISLRDGKLRYSPHFYNLPEEVAAAVEATKEALRE